MVRQRTLLISGVPITKGRLVVRSGNLGGHNCGKDQMKTRDEKNKYFSFKLSTVAWYQIPIN